MANKTSRLNPPEVQSAFKEGARPTNEGRKCQMRQPPDQLAGHFRGRPLKLLGSPGERGTPLMCIKRCTFLLGKCANI